MTRRPLAIPALLDGAGGQPRLDLYALDTRDFGEPDPDQPNPFEWREDEPEIECVRRERKAQRQSRRRP